VVEPRRVALAGSERRPLAGAEQVGAADAAQRVEISLHLRPRTPLPPIPDATHADDGAPGPAALTRAEYEALHGADPADVARVATFARDHGLEVVDVHDARRIVVVDGTVAQLSRTFEVDLGVWQRGAVQYRGRVGPLHVPATLQDVIAGVFGLDDRPQSHPHLRRAQPAAHGAVASRRDALTPLQVARLYDFPRDLDGSGQTVALLELGGGYTRSDLHHYFTALGVPAPQLLDVDVDHGCNAPVGDADSDDGEVQLDVEVLGAIVPGARIAMYFAPNTERGILDAVSMCIHDDVLRPAVLSISWGAAESGWTRQAMRSLDSVFQAAALLGVTVCASSGDAGSSDAMHDGHPHVDFPASSPNVLACGGTRLHLHRDNHALAGEEVWDERPHGGASGGGVSNVFAMPPWQAGAGVPRAGRGVPDVAGNADPASGYLVSIDGVEQVLGGTSAVAPLWAALVVMANQRSGRTAGLITPWLYSQAAQTPGELLRDVTSGGNGAFHARPGWDCCTGLGTPRGARLVAKLAAALATRRS
jgi:kumamolisin